MSDKQKVNVAWISGAYYLAKSVLDKIKEKVKDTESFTCDSYTEFSKLYTMLNSNHCFGSNRFILVFDLPDMTDGEKKKLKLSIENLPEDILLVFYMIDPSKEKAIFNSVEKIGKIYHFENKVSFSNAKDWVDKRTSELGIEIEELAKLAMVENCGYNDKKEINLDILNSAIEKLVLYAPNKKTYNLNEIIATSSFYESFIIWDLLNACDDKDYDKCLNLFEKCVLTSRNVVEALNSVINTLVWKYRLLLFIKDRLAYKIDKETVSKEASSIRRVSYNGTGFNAKTEIDLVKTGPNEGLPVCIWNSGVVFKAINSQYGKKASIELYSRKELYLIIKCLEDCLIFTRSCKYDNEAYLIADIIFMTISSVMDNKSLKIIQDKFMNIRI